MIEATRRKQGTLTPAMIEQLTAYAREGLMRKLALLPDNGLQDDYSDQAREIDQNMAARMSPAELLARQEYREHYCTGAKEKLLERLTRQEVKDQALI